LNSQIIVGTNSFADEIRERLQNELKFISNDQDIINFEEYENKPWLFFFIGLLRHNKHGERRFACRFAVAKAISDLFVNHLEANFAKESSPNECDKSPDRPLKLHVLGHNY
jgi:hypothetical protein